MAADCYGSRIGSDGIGNFDVAGNLQNWATGSVPNHKDHTTALHLSGVEAGRVSDGILLLPADRSLKVGQSSQLAAVAVGKGGGVDITTTARWKSSDDEVAIVSSSGLVTAFSPGVAVITASFEEQSKAKQILVALEKPSL